MSVVVPLVIHQTPLLTDLLSREIIQGGLLVGAVMVVVPLTVLLVFRSRANSIDTVVMSVACVAALYIGLVALMFGDVVVGPVIQTSVDPFTTPTEEMQLVAQMVGGVVIIFAPPLIAILYVVIDRVGDDSVVSTATKLTGIAILFKRLFTLVGDNSNGALVGILVLVSAFSMLAIGTINFDLHLLLISVLR